MRLCPAILCLAVALGAQVRAPFPPTGAVTQDCSVDGTVVNSVTGEPVARARVSFSSGSVSADSVGRFRAGNIACGQIQLVASRPGFLQSNIGPGGTSPRAKPIILDSGGTAHDVRVPLTPQAVVTGIVTDEQADPVPGAQVFIFSARVMQGKRQFQQAMATSANDLGEYRLANLAAGRYVVCAYMSAAVQPLEMQGRMIQGERCYPGPVDSTVVSTFDLVPGREIRVPLSLPMVPAVQVRGTITGLPRARGVALSLAKRGAVVRASARNALVSPDGRFTIPGVPPGSYLLSTDYWEDNKRFTARLPVEVGSGDVDGLTVPLSQGFSIGGTVRVETKDGTVPPRQQFNVGLRSSEPMAGGGRLVWGADGTTFQLAEMTPGTYRMESYGTGNFFLKSALFNGRDLSREAVMINQPGGSVELVLSDIGGSIEGAVQGADGAAANAWVMLLEDGRLPRNSNADATGHFRIPSVAPGSYTLYAWDDFSQVEYADPDWMRRNADGVKVTVTAGQTASVTLVQKKVTAQ